MATVPDCEKSTLDLAVIGNGSFNALINKFGRIVWCCLPRFDSSPLFCRLLTGDESPEKNAGFFDVVVENFQKSEQRYIPNTAIVETRIFDTMGNILKITDFAPRFYQADRWHCPNQFVRILENEHGNTRISIQVRPMNNYGANLCEKSYGSNHISYYSNDFNARLTSDVAIDFIRSERFFLLNKKKFLFFGEDESFKDSLQDVANQFLNLTNHYWLDFSRGLNLPLEWQADVIRSAITLKLCQVESSGAIVAAMTTSIPESENSARNWDYRFCWLRDSYHIIQALNRIGTTHTMENYINFITNIVPETYKELQPLYGILMETDLEEVNCQHLTGYRGQGPVRRGNQAYEQLQNDNYGNIILSVLMIFYDERFSDMRTLNIYTRLENLAEQAFKSWNVKDAGIWELRNSNNVHTFSSVMCWVGNERFSQISRKVGFEEKAAYWKSKADIIHKEIMERAWSEEEQCFMATLKFSNDEPKRELDASVLLLAHLKFIDPKDEKFVKTVNKIEKELVNEGLCFRYKAEDDFGFPENSFIICTFWLIEALCSIGEKEKARSYFTNVLKLRNHVGLFSEDINISTKELWGNFPQAYSMVGIINTAVALSDTWESVGL